MARGDARCPSLPPQLPHPPYTLPHSVTGRGAASVAASALAPVSLGSTPAEAHRKPKVPMMLLVIVTSFVSATTYALCFPSLAPYLVELYPQAGQLLLGLSVAIFSLTKALAAPIVGRVVGAVGTQAPLVALVLLLAASQVLYALASSAWMVVVSRALMGAASTTSTVCRTVVAMNLASREERTRKTDR
jgi:MFS family permease